jgi:hypothetical protein
MCHWHFACSLRREHGPQGCCLEKANVRIFLDRDRGGYNGPVALYLASFTFYGRVTKNANILKKAKKRKTLIDKETNVVVTGQE